MPCTTRAPTWPAATTGLTSEVAGRAVENEDLVNLPNWLPLTFRIGDGAWFELEQRGGARLRAGAGPAATACLSAGCACGTRRGARPGSASAASCTWTNRTWRRWSSVSRRRTGPARWRCAARSTGACATAVWSATANSTASTWSRCETDAVDGDDLFLARCARANRGSRSRWPRAPGSSATVRLAARREQLAGTGPCRPDLPRHADPGPDARASRRWWPSTPRATAPSPSAACRPRQAVARRRQLRRRCWPAMRWPGRSCGAASTSTCRSEAGMATTACVLRLHIFHLLQTASPHSIDLDAGVPARGWHGEAYRGHIFWDELFIFPLLNLRLPEITRSLLMYRYRRLGAARANARAGRLRGAMYPWQSGSDGREESQRAAPESRAPAAGPRTTTYLQRHVNAAIAYNIWQYVQATARHRVPVLLRRRDVPRDRALLGQHRHLQRGARPLRDPRRRSARTSSTPPIRTQTSRDSTTTPTPT